MMQCNYLSSTASTTRCRLGRSVLSQEKTGGAPKPGPGPQQPLCSHLPAKTLASQSFSPGAAPVVRPCAPGHGGARVPPCSPASVKPVGSWPLFRLEPEGFYLQRPGTESPPADPSHQRREHGGLGELDREPLQPLPSLTLLKMGHEKCDEGELFFLNITSMTASRHKFLKKFLWTQRLLLRHVAVDSREAIWARGSLLGRRLETAARSRTTEASGCEPGPVLLKSAFNTLHPSAHLPTSGKILEIRRETCCLCTGNC
ncbi:unnamed protein product [Rangifer tarandus platyrhynchus]|uniref:Uncharacterized protein n=2 Tax=Rangifer tarandus platyrhynchus TaxID=3082113 RepID=A0ABN8YA61_RANTA|nr:unnamed protein product [Rangifer tarandus platyrhynchus]